MKLHYVKTSNHDLFNTAMQSIGNAAKEARTLLVAGEPGTGKTRSVDHFGAVSNAIYIEGLPGMTLAYVRDLLAYEMAGQGLKGFRLQQHIQDTLRRSKQPVILDEAQHGLDNKAAVIEYLRRIVEQAGSVLILVCHTSEKHRFGEHKLAHIATRISAVVDFKPASPADCQLYLKELCEVGVDEAIAQQVHEQSRGRYRLMTSAISTLEALGKRLGKAELTGADVKGFLLCEDAMRSLRKMRPGSVSEGAK